MKPFPSLKYENDSDLLSTCQEPTCQIFWMLLSTPQSCPGVLPGDSRTNVHVVQLCKMSTCFLIISMNSSKSSFPFPLTSYSMTRLSTCRLIWDKLEAKTLIGFRLQLWAITILHQSHHHLPISRQNEERSRKWKATSSSVGFCPIDLMTGRSSFVDIVPLRSFKQLSGMDKGSHRERSAVIFQHCSNGGRGSNPCSKIML